MTTQNLQRDDSDNSDNSAESRRIARAVLPEGLRRETLAVRTALAPSQHGENSEALFLTSGYLQPDAATMARRFKDAEDFTYSRTSNPTVRSLEARIAAMEGTEAAIATSTGMSAILLLGMGLLKAGDHVICSRSVLEPTTRLLFAETPTNPLTDICDIRALADIAHDAGALLAVDNSFCSPALQRPAEHGADIVMHSGTKCLDGQGRVMAGSLAGSAKMMKDVFGPTMRTTGMVLAPFNAWVILKGLETLDIRMRAQSANALQVAQWLEQRPEVARVHYPGLASHPQHALAMRQQSELGGALLSFDLRGASIEAARINAFHVIDSTRVLSIATNLGDTKSIITHPATTSHGRLTEDQRRAAGIGQGLVRLAVGLEHPLDVIDDLQRGLSTLAS